MAEEILRSRHAFGALEKVLEAISSKKVDSYDILFLKDANGKPYIGWVDKDNNPVIIREDEEVVVVDTLPSYGETGKIYIFGSDGYFWNGKEFINLCKPTDVSVFQSELDKLKSGLTDLEAEVAQKANAKEVEAKFEELNSDVVGLANDILVCENTHMKVKYEISDVPVGTLVDYREDEIRVMCPEGTVFAKQSVGAGGNANSYYMAFKTYFPNDDAVGYIEHLGDLVDSEILTKASVDKYGRKYQSTWLAIADYDEATDIWTYRGASSSKDKFIGYDYQIDWYNTDGVMISSDSIRINLSNEECHSIIEPYYISNINVEVDSKIEQSVTESKLYTDERLVAAIAEAMQVIEF